MDTFPLLDVQPFTMSETLLPAFGYYGLCWLLFSHHTNCSAWRCTIHFLSAHLCFVSHKWGRVFRHLCRDIWEPVAPSGDFTGNNIMPHGKQVSPDKNVNFLCAAAPFTVSPVPRTLTCGAALPRDSALYDVSVRRLTNLHSGFLQTPPHGNALAFG